LKVADEFKLPIIADEVYYDLNFGEGTEFHSFANLTTDVPIITTGSISKILCAPGWRLGWCIVYNNHGYFDKVLHNFQSLSTIHQHPASFIMNGLDTLFKSID
jgi:aspartate/methionine/tyrosine aminotransferase